MDHQSILIQPNVLVNDAPPRYATMEIVNEQTHALRVRHNQLQENCDKVSYEMLMMQQQQKELLSIVAALQQQQGGSNCVDAPPAIEL